MITLRSVYNRHHLFIRWSLGIIQQSGFTFFTHSFCCLTEEYSFSWRTYRSFWDAFICMNVLLFSSNLLFLFFPFLCLFFFHYLTLFRNILKKLISHFSFLFLFFKVSKTDSHFWCNNNPRNGGEVQKCAARSYCILQRFLHHRTVHLRVCGCRINDKFAFPSFTSS